MPDWKQINKYCAECGPFRVTYVQEGRYLATYKSRMGILRVYAETSEKAFTMLVANLERMCEDISLDLQEIRQ